MAKRFSDTDLWDKVWFMELPCRLKCLVQAVRSKCDISGVWSPNWIIMCSYVGEKVTESELLAIDDGRQFVKIRGGKIFCVGFIEFQYGELSEKSPVHRKIIGMLDTHKIDYKHPINRVEEKEEEKEEDIEKEEVGEKDKRQQRKFEPPTPDEVSQYMAEINYPAIVQEEAQTFVNFYASKGWMIGKNKMKDWKASVRTWKQKKNEQSNPKTGTAADERLKNSIASVYKHHNMGGG